MIYINRRRFLQQTGVLAIYQSLGPLGLHLRFPNRPYRVGLIGTGWYGKNDLFRLMQVTECQVVALCDVDRQLLEEAKVLIKNRDNNSNPTLYDDYEKMLSQELLDLVIIGTPDHWHALPAVAALEKKIPVYLQKPISVDVLEGEALVKAAELSGAKVQVGLQRRSTHHLLEAKEQIVDAGKLGTVSHVEMCCYYHMRANRSPEVQPIPEFFDYERWVGPAPMRPFDGLPHRSWWRAMMEYSNGICGDMCTHMLDTVRWLLGLGWPKSVYSEGGIYVQTESKATTPDTQTAVFEFDNLNAVWQHRSWGNPVDPDYPWAFFIYGEKGTLKGSVHRYDFIPNDKSEPIIHRDVLYEREAFPDDINEKAIELHTAPATRGQMMDWLAAIETGGDTRVSMLEGHISTASCILANLSMQVGRKLTYDPITKEVVGDSEATKLLARPYREGYQRPN